MHRKPYAVTEGPRESGVKLHAGICEIVRTPGSIGAFSILQP
jgi:hypothetical protein